MKNINLHDFEKHLTFAPLTLTRPVGDLRMGIFTNKERWQRFLPDATIGFITENYIAPAFPSVDGGSAVSGAPTRVGSNTVVRASFGSLLASTTEAETLGVAGPEVVIFHVPPAGLPTTT